MLSALALAAIAGLLLWLLSGRDSTRSETAIDSVSPTYEDMEAAEELRAAEEDVRDLESGARPEEERPGDDWGPGTSRGR